MENYIYELYKKNMQKQMELDFEKENPLIKATFRILPNQTEMRINIVLRQNFHYICSYIVSDFECVRESYIPNELSDLPKGEGASSDEGVRKWYLRWMNSHFDTYKQDYIDYVNKVASEDLGV